MASKVKGLKPEVADLISIALAKGAPKPSAPLEPGLHRLRGTVTLAVDCHIKKGQPSTAKPSIPREELLAIALRVAKVPAKQVPELVEEALAEVAREQESRPQDSREGSTSVVGQVEVLAFEAAA
jgi:hypothetical protein